MEREIVQTQEKFVKKRSIWFLIVTAFLTSLAHVPCCIVPLLISIVGVNNLSLFFPPKWGWVSQYQSLFIVINLITLFASWYFFLSNHSNCCSDKQEKSQHSFLVWLLSIVTLLSLVNLFHFLLENFL